MLNDPHFKVLYYEPESTKVFPNTDIKGGLAISYRNATKDFGAIKIFSFLYDVSSNIFQRLPFVFSDESADGCVGVLGRDDNKRVVKYIRKEYINKGKNLDAYKVFVPQASGSGAFGDVLGTMIVGTPNMAATETFLSIGAFSDEQSAVNLEKYLKTKFTRALLSLLKVTQIGNKPVYSFIPLQDFTSASDIDWSKSISDIDRQLYAKYGLDDAEIAFIESHVKEMS